MEKNGHFYFFQVNLLIEDDLFLEKEIDEHVVNDSFYPGKKKTDRKDIPERSYVVFHEKH